MKFANFRYVNERRASLGDQIQLLAVDYIYRQMGIAGEDIIYIDKNETADYDGEPVILPVNMPLADYCEHGLAGRFSPKITPVFLGLTLLKEGLSQAEADYLRRFEPIGCRDERTFCTMRDCGIQAYLGGCVTALLPRRPQRETGGNGKVFIIDAPEGLRPYIPPEILENAEICTHVLPGPHRDAKEMAAERYRQYADEASLVVTSLMHAASPCMAMGIPVILAGKSVSYRLGWIEKFLHIYTPDEYGGIDWNPAPAAYERQKEYLLGFIKKRLTGTLCEEEVRAVHDFYMDRKRREYEMEFFSPIRDYMDSVWTDPERDYQYAVWGLTEIAELTVDYIGRRYRNARLCHVYDSYRRLDFRGVAAEHPDNSARHPEETVFVTAQAACAPAKMFFEKTGRAENTYAFTKAL